jgi:carbon-monoxide dehydrogenase large subunit
MAQGSGALNLTSVANQGGTTPDNLSRISSIERIDLANDNTANTLTLSASDVVDMQIVHIEAELPNNVGGFRGMGEGGTIGAPAAIANAISDALAPLGLGIQTLPATPERLFQLIRPHLTNSKENMT